MEERYSQTSQQSLNSSFQDDLHESILHLMEAFYEYDPTAIAQPEFHENMVNYVLEIIKLQVSHLYLKEEDDNKIQEKEAQWINTIHETAELFYIMFFPRRSFSDTFVVENGIRPTPEYIQFLLDTPQPKQRTPEWYDFRHNMITASNAYKAFESQSMKNQLIYEKCKPLKPWVEETLDVVVKPVDVVVKSVNVNSTLHWGQKYEPVSILFYEDYYNTKIAEVGCLRHPLYSFLGASPDGINVEPGGRFGRLLEIKNIVNREIDGIPKKEYWIQMQLQLETCNVEECDFLETQFVEYKETENRTSKDSFLEDGDFEVSILGEKKGVILYFHVESTGVPFYVYMPFSIKTWNAFYEWEDEMMQMYQQPPFSYTWIKPIFWKLVDWSCVLVPRNSFWFENNVQTLQEIWNIIERERVEGWEHRAPKKRVITEKKNEKEESLPLDWFAEKRGEEKGGEGEEGEKGEEGGEEEGFIML